MDSSDRLTNAEFPGIAEGACIAREYGREIEARRQIASMQAFTLMPAYGQCPNPLHLLQLAYQRAKAMEPLQKYLSLVGKIHENCTDDFVTELFKRP